VGCSSAGQCTHVHHAQRPLLPCWPAPPPLSQLNAMHFQGVHHVSMYAGSSWRTARHMTSCGMRGSWRWCTGGAGHWRWVKRAVTPAFACPGHHRQLTPLIPTEAHTSQLWHTVLATPSCTQGEDAWVCAHVLGQADPDVDAEPGAGH